MDKKEIKFGSVRELAISTAYYISGSVLGPLVLFMGSGYILDRVFKTGPKLLLAGFFVSFIITNIFLFLKLKKINKLMESFAPKEIKDEPDEISEKNNSK